MLWVARAELLLLAIGLTFASIQSVPNPGVGRPAPWPMLVFAALAVIHFIVAYRLGSDIRVSSVAFVVLGVWAVVFVVGALAFARLPLYVTTLDRPGSLILLFALGLLSTGTALSIYQRLER